MSIIAWETKRGQKMAYRQGIKEDNKKCVNISNKASVAYKTKAIYVLWFIAMLDQ